MTTGYLLDTNHLSHAIRRVSHVRDLIRQARRAGNRMGTCIPVLCETEAGVAQSGRPATYRNALDRMLDELRVWPLDRQDARQYGEVHVELRAAGRTLSHVDIILVVLARRLNLTLLTADRDFEGVPGIRTENCLVETTP